MHSKIAKHEKRIIKNICYIEKKKTKLLIYKMIQDDNIYMIIIYKSRHAQEITETSDTNLTAF